MEKLLNIFIWIPILFARLPTDYPPVRTREVPEHMQDEVAWFVSIGAIILALLLVGYFMGLDKKLAKWLKNQSN